LLPFGVIEVRTKKRNQPPPPRIVFEALTQPDLDPARPWLHVRPNELQPRVLQAEPAALVVWSSLWSERPDAVIRFDLQSEACSGTDLRWTLLVDEPVPDDELLERMRYRLNQLINANLRYSFG
jgi:hypothetical protein